MIKNAILAAAAIAVAAPVAPALADPPPWAPAHGKRAKDAARDWRAYRNYDWNRYERGYDRYYADRYYRDGRYYRPRRLSSGDRIYRGRDGRYYCRRSDGTTGLIIGGIAGGVLGNVIAPGDSKTIGTILGGAAGALIGRSIDRDNITCR